MRRATVVILPALFLLAGCLTDRDDAPGPPPVFMGPPLLFAPTCDLARPAAWPEGCLALASPNDSPSKTEIDLMVNPTDPLNVVVGSKDLDPLASSCVWSVAYVTKDGGATWTTVYVGGTTSERDPTHPLYSFECVTDPIMTFGLDGTAYYALQAYGNRQTAGLGLPAGGEGLESAFFLAVSRDGGLTWPTILPMHVGDGTTVFHDYPRMLTNPDTGSVFATWNQINTVADPAGGTSRTVNQPVVVGTRDGGETATNPTYVPLPEETESLGGLFMNGFAAASNGTIYMTLEGGIPPDGVAGGVWLSVSTDDARTFSTPVLVGELNPIACPLPNAEFRCFSAYEIAVDTSGGAYDGRIHAAWADAHRADGGDGSDILSAWSDDGGMTWSPPVQVNDDPTTNDQFMTRLAVGPDGTVHVVFMDRSFDPGNKLIDATYAYSDDGGANWTSQRLTDVPFDGDIGIHQDGFPFIGDYIGIGVVGEHVYVGFPTTATGRAEVAVAHLMLNAAAASATGHVH